MKPSDPDFFFYWEIFGYWFCLLTAAPAAKSLQLCLSLCNSIDGSPPGSSVPEILRARTLEWVAISFSNACMRAKSLQSYLTLCDPVDSSPPGSSVHGILQARILEGVAFPSPVSLLVRVYSAYLFGWLSRGRFCVSRSLSVLSRASISGIKLFMTLSIFYFCQISSGVTTFVSDSNLSLITFSLFKGFSALAVFEEPTFGFFDFSLLFCSVFVCLSLF